MAAQHDTPPDGEDPDPRFTLANERTFLAWIRTSLALVAAGVALEAFVGDALPPLLRQLLGGVLLVLGAVLAVTSQLRWRRSERALRHGLSLPGLGIAPVLAAGVAVVAVALLVELVLRR